MRAALTLLAAITLSGCSIAGMQYAMDNYKGVSVVHYDHPDSGRTFRVFDKPNENRLMITASAGDAFGQGFSLGTAAQPGILYADAATDWLASTGRTCTATTTTLIMEPQYEVTYTCG